jgi:hypothetical protein
MWTYGLSRRRAFFFLPPHGKPLGILKSSSNCLLLLFNRYAMKMKRSTRFLPTCATNNVSQQIGDEQNVFFSSRLALLSANSSYFPASAHLAVVCFFSKGQQRCCSSISPLVAPASRECASKRVENAGRWKSQSKYISRG